MHYALMGYGAVMVVGFVVGFFVGRGSTAHHLVAGLAGVFVAMILMCFVMVVLRVSFSARTIVRGGRGGREKRSVSS